MCILSSPHCHTDYVDGKSAADEMVVSAIEHGFVSLGFSEHGPQRLDPRCAIADDRIPAYIAEVRALSEKYADRIRIHLGIERDAISHADPAMFDYVLGAVHYFTEGDFFCGVDGPKDKLLEYRDAKYGGDGAQMAADYFGMAGDFALAARPHIFAHFDLIKIRNRDGDVYDPTDRRVVDAQFEALDKVLKSGALLEVNTGGMARSSQPRPYPDMHILKRWREIGGNVIVGSDCHYAPQIDFAYDIAADYIKAAGFRTAWRLGAQGEPLFAEYRI
jgi:histidinol-phosphatase (PHP family)